MITQSILNSEFDLCKRIYLYYWDKVANFISIGSDEYITWYKDLNCLHFISNAIKSIDLVDGELYIGDTLISEDDFGKMTSSMREYINYELRDTVYTFVDADKDEETTTPPIVVVYNNQFQDWRAVTITVLYDDVNALTLPFSLSQVDPEATRVTVNDNDPIHLTQPTEEGCHIVGSTLYWHTYYNLKAGDKVFIQYLITVTQ